MHLNPELIELAQWRLTELTKEAFQPPGGGDPSQGGPPPDPSAGGAPPGMDPSQMGGAPPGTDPSQMGPPPGMAGGPGGAPPAPGGGGLTADSLQQMIQQSIQQAMGAGSPAGAGKPAKPDLNTVAIDIFQVKKMLQYLFNQMGIALPPDILDGPNRDPSTGMPMAPGQPGSTSDPNITAQNAQQQQPPGGQIQPIQPMGGAGGPPPGGGAGGPPPGGGGGGQPPDATKSSEDRALYMGRPSRDGFDPTLISKAAALSAIYRRLRGN